jgi:CHASE1-domain containing sensor protein
MRKSKESTSAVVTDDPTEKSEGTDSYFFRPTKHDLLPLILAIIIIALGLTAALTSFFMLKQNEYVNAQQGLADTAVDAASALSTAVASATTIIQGAASLFQVSKTPITLYDQFVPYMISQSQSASFPKYLTSIGYHMSFPGTPQATAAFEAQMRAQGGDYVNFTVTGRDSSNQPIAPIDVALRAVIVQVVPVASMKPVLGYDVCTDATKNAALQASIASGKPVTSGRVVTALLGPTDVATSIYIAIHNQTTGQTNGAVSSVILMSQLIREALASVTKDVIVSIMDMNATASDSFQGFVFSTSQTLSYKENAQQIANAAYTKAAYLQFADRTFKLILMPDVRWQSRYDTNIRYISLTLSLCFVLILLVGCLILYFSRKLVISRQNRRAAFVQIDLLKGNQMALRTLLDRIASQEAKTRAVINSLPDFVCVISNSGKLLQTNAAFDDQFPFTQQELEKGVYMWSVFTELASDFFKVMDDTQELNTQAARRFGDYIDVSLRVRNLKGLDADSSASHSNELKQNGISSSNLHHPEAEEAFVIIAKSISSKQVETQTEEKMRRHAFERMLRDKEFRDELKIFCEKHKNVENMIFLDRVREYKKASFGERVDMKQQIFDTFIKHGASMQLNLANEVIVEETIKINKSMGDIDVFRNIEECVYKILSGDIYPRLQAEKKLSRKSSTGSESETTLEQQQ